MPRVARAKDENSIYHIMVRSISELVLFKEDEDKLKYLSLIRKYQLKYIFKVYGFCLMDNHGHLLIDVNGADISRIMHSINFCYAQYFNRKYKRHGHVFQDRFKSKIVTDDKYLITLSAYIHNNPSDISGYNSKLEEYRFCSLKDYIKNNNEFEILDKSFLGDILNLKNKNNIKNYLELVYKCDDLNKEIDIEFEMKETEYRSERKIIPRNNKPEEIIEHVLKYTKIDKKLIYIKNNKKSIISRALCTFLMRCFCNYSQKEICEVIGNITQSRVSKLSSIGLEEILTNEEYKDMIESFINIA